VSTSRLLSGIGVALISIFLVAALIWSESSSRVVSDFWASHPMFTNLAASAVFAFVTAAVVTGLISRQRRSVQEQRLHIVRAVAYNAVARAPIAQRRIMWFLVYGGDFEPLPEFQLRVDTMQRAARIFIALRLEQTTEEAVMQGRTGRPADGDRFAQLLDDERWRALAFDVLREAVHVCRLLVARWSALLLSTPESTRALRSLAAQAEELCRIFVEVDPHRPASARGEHWTQDVTELWYREFANAVALEEALIDRGRERAGLYDGDRRFIAPGRHLLRRTDQEIIRRDADRDPFRERTEVRLYEPYKPHSAGRSCGS
jgi:hypothetical protein